MVIGFLDETSPQTTANTQRFWSFGHPTLVKNTTKFRANTFGFYSINGCSVLEFHEHSKKEDVCEFLQSIRKMNPDVDLVIILDNFRSHHAIKTQEYAEENRIDLVFFTTVFSRFEPDWVHLEKHQEDHLTDFHTRSRPLKTDYSRCFQKIWLFIEFCQSMDC